MTTRGLSTTARGLGWAHQQQRARLLPHAIGTRCPIGGPRCDGIMVNPKRMHLDHSTPRALGGTVGDRMVCMPCNLWMGGRLARRLQTARRPRRRPVRSIEW